MTTPNNDITWLWCGFCGAKLAFSQLALERFVITPPCPRCDETDWRDEIDEITAPDHRELPDA